MESPDETEGAKCTEPSREDGPRTASAAPGTTCFSGCGEAVCTTGADTPGREELEIGSCDAHGSSSSVVAAARESGSSIPMAPVTATKAAVRAVATDEAAIAADCVMSSRPSDSAFCILF